MNEDAIELVIDPRARSVGAGIVRRLLPFRRRRMVGPFIFTDLMGPEEFARGAGADIDAHPHVGLSTLTYLLRGELDHRDSTGAVQRIRPGEVNWMTAGAGVCHTERTPIRSRATGGDLFGVQTWVALPADAEQSAPFFEHSGHEGIPQDSGVGSTVRVLAGSGWGMNSQIKGSSPLLQADLTLSDGEIEFPRDHAERAVINLQGTLKVADSHLLEGKMAVVSPGERITIRGDGRAMLLAGDPVGDRFIWWNFVASQEEIIQQAKQDWLNQRFPLVPEDHQRWMPLPK
ncbi:MAG: hypothetical protein CMH41_09805 [Micrococcales bacterium]|nr:hypothetical protein [Micrococcales bacterium]